MISNEEREYLVDSMHTLLKEYDYKCTEEALGKIVDKWAERKASLIEGFKKHPSYVDGRFMIAFTSDFERTVDVSGVRRFSRWLEDNALHRKDLTPQNILDRIEYEAYLPDPLYNFLCHLERYAERCISESTAVKIKSVIPEVRVRVGEKTTRVINRILTYLNYNNVDGYDKEYAKYSDSLSPTTIKRQIVLSLNPLDYLTMSFGNSWASCHTIDKTNRRGMPNSYHGAYSSGTMSYMLDGTSMVFYTVDSSYNGIEYWSRPKINRQMHHYGKEKLIQSRLYPQDNDGCGDEYTFYRNIVQGIMATVLDVSNQWTFKTGCNNASMYIDSYGTHYRDYANFNSCTISRINGSTNDDHIIVGATPMCVRCAGEHMTEDNIDCCIYRRCKHCGKRVHEDDGIEIDGEFYCKRHTYTCEICGGIHGGEGTYIRKECVTVCNTCRDEHYVRCNWCGEYMRSSDTEEHDGKKYCKTCYEEYSALQKRGSYMTWRDYVVAFKNINSIKYKYSKTDDWRWF